MFVVFIFSISMLVYAEDSVMLTEETLVELQNELKHAVDQRRAWLGLTKSTSAAFDKETCGRIPDKQTLRRNMNKLCKTLNSDLPEHVVYTPIDYRSYVYEELDECSYKLQVPCMTVFYHSVVTD